MASKKAVEELLATLTTTFRTADDPQVREDWETMLNRLTDAQVATGRETMILKHQSNFAPAPAMFLEWAKVSDGPDQGKQRKPHYRLALDDHGREICESEESQTKSGNTVLRPKPHPPIQDNRPEVDAVESRRRMGQLRDVMAGKIKLPKNGTPEQLRKALGWPPHRQQREG